MQHNHNVLNYRVVLLSETGPPDEDKALTYRVVPLDVAPTAEPARSYWDEFRSDRSNRRKRKQLWKLETHWYECLRYPFQAWRFLLWLAVAFTFATGVTFPQILHGLNDLGQAYWFLLLGLPFVLVMAYMCGFWNGVLTRAVRGEAGVIGWPFSPRSVLEGMVRCLWCLAAGPLVLMIAGFSFWLHAGDLDLADKLILVELGFMAVAYWLFAFVAVTEKNGLGHATPVTVIKVIRRLGWMALAGALGLFALAFIHGWWAVDALSQRASFFGWLSLWCCTVSMLYWMAFLLRWMGVGSFLRRLKEQNTSPSRKTS